MTQPVLELTLKGTEKVVAVACGTCRIVAANQTMAENCCGPNMCSNCDEECERGWLVCTDCRQKKDAEKLQALYDKAIKIPVAEYGYDQVCQEPYGGEDEYVLADEWDSEERGRNWAWACYPMEWPKFDATDLIYSMLEDDFPEDAGDGLDGDALQKLLDEWLAKQSPSGCFMVDHKRIVVFPEAEEDPDFAGEEMMKSEEPDPNEASP